MIGLVVRCLVCALVVTASISGAVVAEGNDFKKEFGPRFQLLDVILRADGEFLVVGHQAGEADGDDGKVIFVTIDVDGAVSPSITCCIGGDTTFLGIVEAEGDSWLAKMKYDLGGLPRYYAASFGADGVLQWSRSIDDNVERFSRYQFNDLISDEDNGAVVLIGTGVGKAALGLIRSDGEIEWRDEDSGAHLLARGPGDGPDQEGALYLGSNISDPEMRSTSGLVQRITKDGALLWTISIDDDDPATNQAWANDIVVLEDGTLIGAGVSRSDKVVHGFLYAVDSEGTLLWKKQVPHKDGLAVYLSMRALEGNRFAVAATTISPTGGPGKEYWLEIRDAQGDLLWKHVAQSGLEFERIVGERDGFLLAIQKQRSEQGVAKALTSYSLTLDDPDPLLSGTEYRLPEDSYATEDQLRDFAARYVNFLRVIEGNRTDIDHSYVVMRAICDGSLDVFEADVGVSLRQECDASEEYLKDSVSDQTRTYIEALSTIANLQPWYTKATALMDDDLQFSSSGSLPGLISGDVKLDDAVAFLKYGGMSEFQIKTQPFKSDRFGLFYEEGYLNQGRIDSVVLTNGRKWAEIEVNFAKGRVQEGTLSTAVTTFAECVLVAQDIRCRGLYDPMFTVSAGDKVETTIQDSTCALMVNRDNVDVADLVVEEAELIAFLVSAPRLEACIGHGMSVDLTVNENNSLFGMVMAVAAREQRYDAVRLLIRNGADVNNWTPKGQDGGPIRVYALQWALEKGQAETATAMIEHGASVWLEEVGQDRQPIVLAAEGLSAQHAALIKRILDATPTDALTERTYERVMTALKGKLSGEDYFSYAKSLAPDGLRYDVPQDFSGRRSAFEIALIYGLGKVGKIDCAGREDRIHCGTKGITVIYKPLGEDDFEIERVVHASSTQANELAEFAQALDADVDVTGITGEFNDAISELKIRSREELSGFVSIASRQMAGRCEHSLSPLATRTVTGGFLIPTSVGPWEYKASLSTICEKWMIP